MTKLLTKQDANVWLEGYPEQIPGKLSWESEFDTSTRINNWEYAHQVLMTPISSESVKLAHAAGVNISETPNGLMLADLPNVGKRSFGLTGSTISIDHELYNVKFSVRFEAITHQSYDTDRLYRVAELPKTIQAMLLNNSDKRPDNEQALRIAAYKDLVNRRFIIVSDAEASDKNTVISSRKISKIRIGEFLEAELLRQGLMNSSLLQVSSAGQYGIFAGLKRNQANNWAASFVLPNNSGALITSHHLDLNVIYHQNHKEVLLDLPSEFLAQTNIHREESLRYGVLINKLSK